MKKARDQSRAFRHSGAEGSTLQGGQPLRLELVELRHFRGGQRNALGERLRPGAEAALRRQPRTLPADRGQQPLALGKNLFS